MKIREINPHSETEIGLVAQRMRQTLVEVLGKERGTAMYSMEWLVDRVRWHLDPLQTNGKVFLLEDQTLKIVGHAIARVDPGAEFGYFSTLFIDESIRRQGFAGQLVTHVEAWFLEQRVSKIVYNTARDHRALIKLFESRGFAITLSEGEMVQLTKFF